MAAADVTRGHRFAGSASIRVRLFADHEKQLRSNGVLVRPTERLEKIQRELAGHAKKGSYRIHEDADLMKLVTYHNELPLVNHGVFTPAFMHLPIVYMCTVMICIYTV